LTALLTVKFAHQVDSGPMEVAMAFREVRMEKWKSFRACGWAAKLLDVHDEWQAAERRYFSESSMATLNPERDNGPGSLSELQKVADLTEDLSIPTTWEDAA
jgi:hypothetical protein